MAWDESGGVLWRPVPPVSVRIRDLSGSAESVRIRDPRKRPEAVGRKSARTGLSDPARGPGGGPAAAVPEARDVDALFPPM